VIQYVVDNYDDVVQADFLNSVIVDLQRKNESLQLQLEAAVSLQNKLNDEDDVALKYVTCVSVFT